MLENQFLGAKLSPETEQKTHSGGWAQLRINELVHISFRPVTKINSKLRIHNKLGGVDSKNRNLSFALSRCYHRASLDF